MAEASLKLGGSWATKEGSLLGFNDQNGNYKPIPFDFTRATTATRVNRDGLIEEVQSGVPRIDFTDSAGYLLLEPQRTNSISYSENFSGSGWSTARATAIANAAISPEGLNNATKFNGSSDNATHYVYFNPPAATSGQGQSFSVYAKAGELSYLSVFFSAANGTFGGDELVVNLSDGSVDSVDADITENIVDAGNGWYRIEATRTALASAVGIVVLRLHNGTSATFVGSASEGVYIYGAQQEINKSYPTSYIPTSGSAVTRNEDVCSATGISNVIGQSEGVIFMDFIWDNSTAASADYPIMVYGSDTSNFVGLNTNTNTNQMLVYSGGSVVAAIGGGDFVVGQRYKVAMAYKLNDFAYYINGEQKGTDTAGAIPIGLQSVRTETPFSSKKTGQKTKEIIFYNERLTNTQLAELTTI